MTGAEYYRQAAAHIARHGHPAKADPAGDVSARAIYKAWSAYFRAIGWRPYAFQQIDAGAYDRPRKGVTVPCADPRDFDPTYEPE